MQNTSKLAVFGAAVLAVSALLIQPAVAVASADADVLAVVNGTKIMKNDVKEAMKQLPVDPKNEKEIINGVVNQMINEKLIDEETTKAKIADSEDFKKRMDVIKTQLLRQIFLENQLKDKISDKAVKAEYEKFKNENKGKQEIHARHILVPTEEEAKQVIKDLDAGKKFEELAAQRSSGPAAEKGGDLGYFVKDEMIPEFSDAAFKLKPGTYTKEPVKTQFGWHVIKVEDKRDRKVPSLDQVEAAIKNKLGMDAMKSYIDGLRAKADIKMMGEDAPKTEKN